MNTDTTPKERPTGSANYPAGHTDKPIVLEPMPAGNVREKQFATLRAQFALRGHSLHRTSPGNGPETFNAERWGLVRHLNGFDEALRFLVQIGGAA